MNRAISTFFDWIVLALLWCLAILIFGGVFRVAKEIFCLGYGCNV